MARPIMPELPTAETYADQGGMEARAAVGRGREINARGLRRMGVNPSAGRYAGSSRRMEMAGAAQVAGARSQGYREGSVRVEQMRRGREADVMRWAQIGIAKRAQRMNAKQARQNMKLARGRHDLNMEAGEFDMERGRIRAGQDDQLFGWKQSDRDYYAGDGGGAGGGASFSNQGVTSRTQRMANAKNKAAYERAVRDAKRNGVAPPSISSFMSGGGIRAEERAYDLEQRTEKRRLAEKSEGRGDVIWEQGQEDRTQEQSDAETKRTDEQNTKIEQEIYRRGRFYLNKALTLAGGNISEADIFAPGGGYTQAGVDLLDAIAQGTLQAEEGTDSNAILQNALGLVFGGAPQGDPSLSDRFMDPQGWQDQKDAQRSRRRRRAAGSARGVGYHPVTGKGGTTQFLPAKPPSGRGGRTGPPTKDRGGYFIRSAISTGIAESELLAPDGKGYTQKGKDLLDTVNALADANPEASGAEILNQAIEAVGVRSPQAIEEDELADLIAQNKEETGQESPDWLTNESDEFHQRWQRIKELRKSLGRTPGGKGRKVAMDYTAKAKAGGAPPKVVKELTALAEEYADAVDSRDIFDELDVWAKIKRLGSQYQQK